MNILDNLVFFLFNIIINTWMGFTNGDANSIRPLHKRTPDSSYRINVVDRNTGISVINITDIQATLPLLASRKPLDRAAVALEYIRQKHKLQAGKKCKSISISQFNISENGFSDLNASLQQFRYQVDRAIKTANVISNLLQTTQGTRSWDHSDWRNFLYNKIYYYSLVKAMVNDEPSIFGARIAFDKNQFRYTNKPFCPFVTKINNGESSSPDLNVGDLGDSLDYTNRTPHTSWFWRVKDANTNDQVLSHNERKTFRDQRVDSPNPTKYDVILANKNDGLWTFPFYSCDSKSWLVTYSVPFYGKDDGSRFKGVVALDISLSAVDINQCSEEGLFSGTHKCKLETTQCVPIQHQGFTSGAYTCRCHPGYYFPNSTAASKYYNGLTLEAEYLRMLENRLNHYDADAAFQCLPCRHGCKQCDDDSTCLVESNILLRGVPLGIQSFCMTVSLIIAFIIVRLRKTKVMKASMWAMLEVLIFGSLLLYATVVIQYFEPDTTTCLLIPWFREIGFAIVYGALLLKVYRVLAEFQSRKARRVHVRDKDLLKYLLGIVLIVVGYMAAWTAVNVDHVQDGASILQNGTTPENVTYFICESHWWDYVIEIGEFLFLCLGIYLCYCTRSAPSDYNESRYISWAIYNETVVSALVHITRHFLWLSMHPDYIFLMYFVRCQLTVTTTICLVIAPKLWYAHKPPDEDNFRARAFSQTDVHETILPETMKLHVGVSSNGDVDIGDVNLSEMDPEDIRSELKRLYTQLQIYKTKTMRKDNPHISKRRGGRKQTHRRFSLQAFHHKHRHHHDHEHEHELSKTPEESTNSAEGVAIAFENASKATIEEGGPSHSTGPTVTFKPGHHKSIS
ncbi:unnamed protein product [Owenia fusiformis]|uniref:Uncharacterized protein n=1 Tax=Owenia fusiformis TaxID=6347 RepID=A0A8J1UKF7_OWEFU|nr:unnamed protein product [Owenia fusiformis]